MADLIVSRGQSVGVLCCDNDHCARVSDAIWTGSEFLAHALGTHDDVSKVHLATSAAKGDVLLVVDNAEIPKTVEVSRLCLIFHAADTDNVNLRRADWKAYLDNGTEISYWAENENGSWEKMAESNTKSIAKTSDA